MTFDIQNDEGMLVLSEKLKARPDIAGLLKEASIDAEFGDLIDSAFADPENRMFPIFSPEQALVSAAYLDGTDNELAKTACEQALVSWNHDTIKISSLEKQASHNDTIPAEMFLLKSERKLPVVDMDTLEKSASYMSSNWDKMNEAQKFEASSNLYKFATEIYGVNPSDMSENVLAYSQKLPCDLHKLAMAVSDRYAETHLEGYRPLMEKIANLKNEIGGSVSFDEALNTGIAYELSVLDKEASVDKMFSAIKDTFNSAFVGEELAKLASTDIVIGGITVTAEQLQSVDSFTAERALGSDICKEASIGDSLSGDSLVDYANASIPELAEEIGEYIGSL